MGYFFVGYGCLCWLGKSVETVMLEPGWGCKSGGRCATSARILLLPSEGILNS